MNRFIGVLIFLLSIVCFIISVDVFYIQAIFVDEHNFSMGEIFGGNFNLYMVWIRLFLRRFSASSPVLECSPRRNRDDYKKTFIGNCFAFYGHFGKYSWMI